VHLFACAFYRIKRDFSPDPEQVEIFYSSRNVDQNVGKLNVEWGRTNRPWPLAASITGRWLVSQPLATAATRWWILA
jgi:hypothetical protein